MYNFAVIFDMDGVLSATEKLHSRVEIELLGNIGIVVSESYLHSRFAGVSDSDMFSIILKNFNILSTSAEELTEKKRKIFEIAIIE